MPSSRDHPRRRYPPQEATEISPLNPPATTRQTHPNPQYSTFPRKPSRHFSTTTRIWDFLQSPNGSSRTTCTMRKLAGQQIPYTWIHFSVFVFVVLFFSFPLLVPRQASPVSRRECWIWDYNVYHAKSENEAAPKRNLLLAQISGSLALEELSDISSLPNRAYARQWRRDYARYSSGSKSAIDACLNKVYVLNAILDKQQQSSTIKQSSRSVEHYAYDAIALFPTDAIIINLDYDLSNLMPSDKLVALAGWQPDSRHLQASQTDVVLFNLRHPYAETVARLWQDLTADVTCGASNELQLLVQVIASVASENWESLIHGLEETDQGYIGKESRVIKSIFPSVPAPRFVTLLSDLTASRQALQTTADSVCYRYYPKCEVL